MNKKQLIDMIAEKTGFSKKDSEKALGAVTESISEALANGESVQLIGFGTFEVKDRPARIGHNLHTGEKISIPASRLAHFKSSATLKKAVNHD